MAESVPPSEPRDRIRTEAEVAKRYFGSFADDYHRAFEGRGKHPLHAVANALFRRKTFERRTALVREWLGAYRVSGKHVLELGCGSGEVSIVAARLGARVTGLDIVPDMIEIARTGARDAGVSDLTTFRVANFAEEPIPRADVVMMVGVIEYYRDIDAVLPRVCESTGERLIIVDTRGPWWRRRIRFALARLKHFHLYYHAPDRVSAIVRAAGFEETDRVAGHSYTALAYRRTAAA